MTVPDHTSGLNLLVSTGRGLEANCISALKKILVDHDSQMEAWRSPFSGLVACRVRQPREAVAILVAALDREPWHNDLIKRAVPIDVVVPGDIDSIAVAAEELRDGVEIPAEWSFRVRVRKRGAAIDRMSLIERVADLFPNGVDLESPDFEVRIEMLRRWAGVSILRRGEIFPDL